MPLFNKPFGEYLKSAKVGIGLLLLVSVLRLLLKPVWQVPYAEGTNFASVTILLPILMLVYSVMVARSGGSYRDLLGVSAALCSAGTLFIIMGIAISSFAGIDSYYVDPAHGGNVNVWLHMGGHVLVNGILFTLVMWGVGSLSYLLAGGGRKRAMA